MIVMRSKDSKQTNCYQIFDRHQQSFPICEYSSTVAVILKTKQAVLVVEKGKAMEIVTRLCD